MPVLILHTDHLDPDPIDTLTRQVPGELEARIGHHRLHTSTPPVPELLAELRTQLPFDLNPLPEHFDAEGAGLLVTDMDSTLINIECIDEIADFAGVKPQVAAITEAAMRGEIDFATSLTRRVHALAGIEQGALAEVYDQRLRLNEGAEELVAGLHRRGARVALVSGGFTFFTERLQQALELDYTRANVLAVQNGFLTGEVVGDIVDGAVKAAFLRELREQLGLEAAATLAMGDGANDLSMMREAGLGVAYRAKPRVQAQADAVLNHAPLDAVLHFLA